MLGAIDQIGTAIEPTTIMDMRRAGIAAYLLAEGLFHVPGHRTQALLYSVAPQFKYIIPQQRFAA